MRKKYYAFKEHTIIEAVSHELFRFRTRAQAEQMVEQVKAEFIISAPRNAEEKKQIKLWVRDYAVTPQERQQGYLGHYALLNVNQTKNGRWTLSFTKVDAPLRQHPQRKVTDRTHPNWGHPLLKSLGQTSYPNLETAQAALDVLHQEYPLVSIPGLCKLKIMVYRKPTPGKPAIQKLELVARKQSDGSYRIMQEEAVKRDTKAAYEHLQSRIREKARVAQGRYTALVARQENRKRA